MKKHKHKISLAFKLNTLIIAIVVTISVTLLFISFAAYQRVYVGYRERLGKYSAELTKKTDKYAPLFSYMSAGFESEGFSKAKERYKKDEDEDRFFEWMNTITNTKLGNSMSIMSDYVEMLIEMSELCKNYSLDAVVVISKTDKGWIQLVRAEKDSILGSQNINYLGAPAADAYISEKAVPPTWLRRGSRTEIASFVPIKTDYFTGGIWLCYDVTNNIEAQRVYLRICLLSVLILTLVFVGIGMFLLRKIATKPLKMLSEATSMFSAEKGSYTKDDVIRLDICSNDEIGDLYRDFQSMQNHIVEYTENLTRMTAETEKTKTELNLASKIQEGILPHTFPPYPDRTEFDIYASMDPVRGVGGDFYDFFLIDEDHLCLVIADVSGKGVPAALFMMISKVIVKNCAMLGKSPADILAMTNEIICSNNQADMFVTIWTGILEISTGKLTAANAGHEYPAVYRSECGLFEVLHDKHGFVIGGMSGMKYREYELMLQPDDKIFVYTDGIPESTDTEDKPFGMERMTLALNEDPGAAPEKVIMNMRGALNDFVKEAEQFDDITMLCVEYRG